MGRTASKQLESPPKNAEDTRNDANVAGVPSNELESIREKSQSDLPNENLNEFLENEMRIRSEERYFELMNESPPEPSYRADSESEPEREPDSDEDEPSRESNRRIREFLSLIFDSNWEMTINMDNSPFLMRRNGGIQKHLNRSLFSVGIIYKKKLFH